ncbi:MAG: hypothetical protein R2802_13205 [Flavobacteriaceae bacterium]|nr:hypothetical protein [Mangrovimonas sp.]MCB0427601.1 hypothetical protein [Mangrovimonas sp.]MCB0437693.1 hypothetical protein [Mangrovimonas sp.]HPF96186.1 hypothetical protein [Mangrovimonas sp.]
MLSSIPSHLPNLPIYKKALEIVILSRSISAYLNYDFMNLNSDGSENKHIYFSGDIVQQSVSLAPEIEKAEKENFPDQKHKHASTLLELTNRLYKSCIRLEYSNSDGKDYLSILRSELKAFRKLQRSWMLNF